MQHSLIDLSLILMAFVAIGGCVWSLYHQRVSEATRLSREQGQTLFQAMIEDQKDLVCRFDGDGNSLFVNESFCRFFNRTRNELIGLPVSDFLGEENAGQLRQRMVGLHPNSPTMEVEHTVERHDGVERWLRWALTGMFDGDGALKEVHCVGRDITERKLSEDALKESEKRLRLFTDAMPALFSYIDKDRKYRFCNLHYEKHFRLKRDQIIGRTVAEVEGEDTYNQIKPVIDRALSGENVFFEQWVNYPVAGNTFIRGSMIPDVSPSGEVEGFFVMVQDMTARKYAEETLAKAKEKAEENSAAKSRFLAAASHDLRQPMQALALFIDVLAGRMHDTESRDIIEKIQASSKALEGLLNTLLDISKLESDLVKPEFRRFAAGELTARLAEEIRPLAEEKGVRLVHIASSLPVRSDPGLLDRVLRNLLTNAVRNTEKGKILFGCRRRGKDLRFEVWDTGAGIPEDQIELIFEEFYQRNQTGGTRSNGLGLGLAIVDRLVKLLHHRIEVASLVGRGSVFRVRVPIANSAKAEKIKDTSLAGKTVKGALIVGIDDDPAVRDALSMLLQSWGFEAVTAASEEDAVKQLARVNRSPDLVIADYRLEEGDNGSHAIDTIRRRWGEKIPGLLLTATTDPKDVREARESGFQVVQKPIRPEKLKAVVAQHMEGSGRASNSTGNSAK